MQQFSRIHELNFVDLKPQDADLRVRVWRRLKKYYRRCFQNKNHVFVHRGPFPPVRCADCTFDRYDRIEAVPDHIRNTILDREGQVALDMDQQEIECGAVLWVVNYRNVVAGIRLCHRGCDFYRWYVPLSDADIVICRGRTFPEYRGLGISPAMIGHIMHTELVEGSVAYADCKVHNHASMRSLAKAGFKNIATRRAITREEAMGSGWTSCER